MNVLLWKDLYSVKRTLAVMMFIAAVYSWWLGKGGPMSFFIGSAFVSTVIGTSISLDEKSGITKFMISSGIGRSSVAANKMLLSVAVTLLGTMSGFAAIGLASLGNTVQFELMPFFTVLVFGISFGLFISAAMMYFCFRFGSSYAGIFAAFVIGGSAGVMIGLAEILGDLLNGWAWIFPVIAAVFLCASAVLYVLSRAYLEKKDF